MESDKGVTIYCIKETEDENEDTQVTEVSEPKTDVKTPENIEPVVTEAVEAPRATQTKEDSNVAEIEELRYEHRESLEIATEDAVPREKSEISEDADPRYEHRENADTVTEDAVAREISKEVKPTENTGILQAILADPTEDTEVPEQTVSEEIEITDTIDVTEVITGIPKPTLEVTSEKKEESTSPGSLHKENPEIQNNSEDTTGIDAEQVNKKTHKHPETNNSLVNKIFSVFRQAKESMEIIPL